MKITRLTQLERVAMAVEGAAGVSKHVPIGQADGAPNFSFRVFTVEPGGHTPYHVHDAEHVNYIIQGQGALVDEHGKHHPVAGGDFAFVPPKEKHQYRNTSATEPFVMICAVPKQYE